MAKTKFGLSQIGAVTPMTAKWIFRFILYAVAAITLILDTVSEIPAPVSAAISKYCIYGVTLVHGFSKLWGIDLSDAQPPTNTTGKN